MQSGQGDPPSALSVAIEVFGGHFPCPSPLSSTYDGRDQNFANTLEHCNQIYHLRHDFVHAALCGDAPDMTRT
jgi:hypothetical protein